VRGGVGVTYPNGGAVGDGCVVGAPLTSKGCCVPLLLPLPVKGQSVG
jgi:hypothetical protein